MFSGVITLLRNDSATGLIGKQLGRFWALLVITKKVFFRARKSEFFDK
jgi:hypothetical protein